MADNSRIEWTDATWNPITGCSRVSRGCGGPDGGGCYAERLAATRLRRHPSRRGLTDRHGRWTGEVRFQPQWLGQPVRWRKPRRIFVCAHSDLFHERVPDGWIDRVMAVAALAPRHSYQVLTKRPERMREYMRGRRASERIHSVLVDWLLSGREPPVRFTRQQRQDCERMAAAWAPMFRWPMPHVWLGVSAEDQETVNERIVPLLETPAAVRWLSAEPLLEEVYVFDLDGPIDLWDGQASPLHWVVCGGESGPRARPLDPDWARSLRDQCERVNVPFFFKQWGGPRPKSHGRVLDGRTWDGMPLLAGAAQ